MICGLHVVSELKNICIAMLAVNDGLVRLTLVSLQDDVAAAMSTDSAGCDVGCFGEVHSSPLCTGIETSSFNFSWTSSSTTVPSLSSTIIMQLHCTLPTFLTLHRRVIDVIALLISTAGIAFVRKLEHFWNIGLLSLSFCIQRCLMFSVDREGLVWGQWPSV